MRTILKQDFLAILLICISVYSAYLNTLPNSYIFDDRHMVVGNNYIKHREHLPKLFGDKITSFPIAKGMWRPLLMLSFAFNYFFSGLSPYGYHLINILLHFLNAVLLYLLIRLFLKDLGFYLSLGLTLIFCLHPINTEAVTYISSRSVTLSSLFILLSLYSYIQWRATSQKRLYLSSLACYVLALASKETGLITPLLIAGYEFVYTPGLCKEGKKLFFRLLPFILITTAYLFFIKLTLGEVSSLFIKTKIPAARSFASNILTQAAVAFFYLYLFFFPLNLCVDRAFPIINSLASPLGLTSLILVCALIIGALFLKNRLRLISLAILWYFICLLPQFYGRLNIVAAEHHSYLANFALYFILGYALSRINLSRRLLRLMFIFVLGLFFLLTLIRNLQWRNEYTLWKAELSANPKSEIALGSLGLYLINRGFDAEGEAYLKQAMNSKKEIVIRPSLLNLASTYALFKNDPEKGLEILNQKGGYLKKVSPVGYFKTLGIIYMKMGKTIEAKEAWEQALRLYPGLFEIKSNLGWWYLKRDPPENREAKRYFEEALKDNPDFVLAHLGLGATLEKENLDQAIQEYEKALRLDPEDPNAYYRIGLLYAYKLLDSRAEWYFKKTVELIPGFAPAYYNLCLFYLSLEKPDYPKAREYLKQAQELGFQADKKVEEILQRVN